MSIIDKSKKLIKKLSTPGESLSEKTLKGGLWVFSLRITVRLFQLVRTIILARVLSPNDFGLFGIALLVLSTLETFSEAGFSQALVQKKGETKQHLNTAWTVSIIRGFLIAAIVFFLAKPAASFFDAPAAENIIRVIGAAIVLQGLTNISVLYFQKELRFHKFFQYQFLGTIADVIVAISAAYILKSVWALVFGLLAGNLVRCIMSYVIDPYRPKFQLDIVKAKELFGFGKWILGSNILIFLITQGDDIFVGKLLGATMLGFYQMAYKISNLPATEITHAISQVSFPAYSKLQNNIPKLREAYLKVLQLTSFISLPIAGFIFILAPDFTKIFLGDKWTPMIPAMQILCLFGAIRSINATFGPLYQAVGAPRILAKVSFMQLFLLAIIIYPLTNISGLTGASIAVTVANFFCMVVSSYEAFKILGGSYRRLISTIRHSVIVTAAIIVFVYLFRFVVMDKIPLYYTFIVSIILGLTIYLIYALMLGFSFKKFFKEGKIF